MQLRSTEISVSFTYIEDGSKAHSADRIRLPLGRIVARLTLRRGNLRFGDAASSHDLGARLLREQYAEKYMPPGNHFILKLIVSNFSENRLLLTHREDPSHGIQLGLKCTRNESRISKKGDRCRWQTLCACSCRCCSHPVPLRFRTEAEQGEVPSVRPRYPMVAALLQVGSGAAWMGGRDATAARDKQPFLPTETNSCFPPLNVLSVGGFNSGRGLHRRQITQRKRIFCHDLIDWIIALRGRILRAEISGPLCLPRACRVAHYRCNGARDSDIFKSGHQCVGFRPGRSSIAAFRSFLRAQNSRSSRAILF